MQHGWTRLGGDPARQSSAPDYWRGAAVGFAGSPWSERRRRSPLGKAARLDGQAWGAERLPAAGTRRRRQRSGEGEQPMVEDRSAERGTAVTGDETGTAEMGRIGSKSRGGLDGLWKITCVVRLDFGR
jgi:hypothetical protein